MVKSLLHIIHDGKVIGLSLWNGTIDQVAHPNGVESREALPTLWDNFAKAEWGENCTRNGVTSRHQHVIFIGEGIPEQFEPRENIPAVVLIKREIWSNRERKRGNYLHAEPVTT